MKTVKISLSDCINEWILTKLAQKDCWKKTKSCICSLGFSWSDSTNVYLNSFHGLATLKIRSRSPKSKKLESPPTNFSL